MTIPLTQCVIFPFKVRKLANWRLYIQYKSALTTFDILVNFTRLSAQTLQELSEELDNPSNGMTLEGNAHLAFDNFDWCLKKTEVSFMALNLSSYS